MSAAAPPVLDPKYPIRSRFRGWVLRDPVGRAEEPASEKRNVKTQAAGH